MTHPQVDELHAGFDYLDTRLICLNFTTSESEPAIRIAHESIRRCMPCKEAGCSHGWKTFEFEDGSGYYATRTCLPANQISWNSPAMIDHHEATANGVITCTQFHSFAAAFGSILANNRRCCCSLHRVEDSVLFVRSEISEFSLTFCSRLPHFLLTLCSRYAHIADLLSLSGRLQVPVPYGQGDCGAPFGSPSHHWSARSLGADGWDAILGPR